MAEFLRESMQLPGNLREPGVGEVSTEKLPRKQDVLILLLVLLVNVCNGISIFLYRAKCEGRCGSKQWSGDHVC